MKSAWLTVQYSERYRHKVGNKHLIIATKNILYNVK